MSRPCSSVNCRLRVPNFLLLARSGTFQSSGLCACPHVICRTLPCHRFCGKFYSASAGFCFFCDLVCRRSATPCFFDEVLIVRPTIVRFLCSPNSEFQKFRRCLRAGFYDNVTSLCRYPTSVNLAYLDKSSVRSDSVTDCISFPLWKDPFRFLYFSFRHRSGVRFCLAFPVTIRRGPVFLVFALNRRDI